MDDPIEAAREWMNRIGPANCWTGTHAESARHVFKLLAVINQQSEQLERAKVENELE